MSNIAGKVYAMNVITPIRGRWLYLNKVIFWSVKAIFAKKLLGLLTLSLIHYARWVVIKPNQFPHLDPSQPKEDLKYSYMIFESNFNGSWEQYVDSFHSCIPSGLDLLWFKNVGFPKSSPLTPFYKYINHNQIWTGHYYSAYPMAASNDVKAGAKVMNHLQKLGKKAASVSAEEFQQSYNEMLLELQHSISEMNPSPIVSLSAEKVEERRNQKALKLAAKKS